MNMDRTGGLDFKSMPKIELHAHLTGSISRQCLHDVWEKKESRDGKGSAELNDPLIEMPEDRMYDLATFFPLFSKYIYKLCNDKETIIYTTDCVLRDFQNDGVVYLELRTTPRQIKTAGISKEEYVKTVLTCISNFNSATMVTKLILSIDRTNTEEEAMEVVDIASKYKDQGIVAVDLCGNPTKGDVSIFRSAYSKAKQHGLKITLHFAESLPSSTDLELQTLLSYEPDRIGHVILVPDDIKQTIIERKLGLELCLSCNVKFKMTTGSYSDHHFEFWMSTGCPIILCTDDVGVVESSLSNEYALVEEHFGFDRSEILGLARSGIDAIFGGDVEKGRLRRLMWQ